MKKESDTKKSKFNIIIIILLLIVILFVISYFVYKKIYVNNNASNNNNNNLELIDTSNYKYSMKVYKTDTNEFCFEYQEDTCKDLFFTIKTETDNSKILSNNRKYILYDDNGLKLYNFNNSEIVKINLENSYDYYNLIFKNDNDDMKFIGIIYQKNDFSGYYDYKLNKTLYKDNNGKLLSADNNRYILYLTDGKMSIYDKYDGKIVKENINLDSTYSKYKILDNYEIDRKGTIFTNEILGIFASNENNDENIYYNLEKNVSLYKNQYNNISQKYKDFVIGTKSLNSENDYATIDYILDPYEEKILLQPTNPNAKMMFSAEEYNGKYYYFESTDLVGVYYTKTYIYSNDRKLMLISNKANMTVINSKGELFFKKENSINKYNIDGVLLDIKNYEKVVSLTINDKKDVYLIVVNEGKLSILDANFNELVIVTDWKDNYQFKQYPPVYLTLTDSEFNPNNAYEDGIYMVLEDENNYTEYYFNPKTKDLTSRKIDDLNEYDLQMNWADLS